MTPVAGDPAVAVKPVDEMAVMLKLVAVTLLAFFSVVRLIPSAVLLQIPPGDESLL